MEPLPGPSRLFSSAVAGLLAASVALATTGCSIRKLAIGGLADTLAASGNVFASDDDPELIRAAVPFSLKTIESLLAEVPDHPGLLLSACTGFTQYAYAFIQTDADLIEADDFEQAEAMRERARRMYLRATRYCLRRLDRRAPGIEQALRRDPDAALAVMTRGDAPTLYWTGAALGSAVALGLDRPELIADFPVARAVMLRALALDETYGEGAIHAAMVSIESVPDSMGGSPARARRHFARAIELSGGRSAGPYVTLARVIALPAQDRTEFERLLNEALAIDADRFPSWRLANLIAQKHARHLLARADALFLPDEPDVPPGSPLGAFHRAGVAVPARAGGWARVRPGIHHGELSWTR